MEESKTYENQYDSLLSSEIHFLNSNQNETSYPISSLAHLSISRPVFWPYPLSITAVVCRVDANKNICHVKFISIVI